VKVDRGFICLQPEAPLQQRTKVAALQLSPSRAPPSPALQHHHCNQKTLIAITTFEYANLSHQHTHTEEIEDGM